MENKTKTLSEKMFEIQNLNLKYHKTADGYNYKYLPLEELWKVLQPELEKRGLLVWHYTENKEVITTIVDTENSNNTLLSSIPLPNDTNPQKLGSAITYFKRYNLGQLFNIITDEDDDAQSTVPKKKTETKSVEKKDVAEHFHTEDDLAF